MADYLEKSASKSTSTCPFKLLEPYFGELDTGQIYPFLAATRRAFNMTCHVMEGAVAMAYATDPSTHLFWLELRL